MIQKAFEVNFDGIVGPTHNYSGLSYGNVASIDSKQSISNPKAAALQGLAKMHTLMQLGVKQAFLPPLERPFLPVMRELGFVGSDEHIVQEVFRTSKELFFSCCSASSMWTANAATICPSVDSEDGLVHITTANLSNKFHRSIESQDTSKILHKVFSNPKYFAHHQLIPHGNAFADEGAANHTRFCSGITESGIHLFVYGRQVFDSNNTFFPSKYPARQSLEASQAVAKLHLLRKEQTLFAQQNPIAVDAGVFHNDVIAVGHETLFLFHEQAYVNTDEIITQLQSKMLKECGRTLTLIKVTNQQIPLETAVRTYLFNSQIVTLPNHSMHLIAPKECEETAIVKQFIDAIVKNPDYPINSVQYLNLHESMRNGGGPACLRLRVLLTEEELAQMYPSFLLTPERYEQLVAWVNKHYRDTLSPNDLADPQLLHEVKMALDELTNLLGIGSIYHFQ